MFSNSSIGLVLLVTHILAALTVGIVLGLISRFSKESNYNKFDYSVKSDVSNSSAKLCTFSNLGEILSNAILESSKTIIMIGGFVVIFSVIISIFNKSGIIEIVSYALYPILRLLNINTTFESAILSGIIELTNGVSIVSGIANKSISTNVIICAFLLGFGGISVMLQVLSITSKSDLSIKKYIFGKVLQGIIAAGYVYILLSMIPTLNFNF